MHPASEELKFANMLSDRLMFEKIEDVDSIIESFNTEHRTSLKCRVTHRSHIEIYNQYDDLIMTAIMDGYTNEC